MWGRAPRETRSQQLRVGCVIASVPARCPSDYLERVIVPIADDITARVCEAPHASSSRRRGPVYLEVFSLLARLTKEPAVQEVDARQRRSDPATGGSVWA